MIRSTETNIIDRCPLLSAYTKPIDDLGPWCLEIANQRDLELAKLQKRLTIEDFRFDAEAMARNLISTGVFFSGLSLEYHAHNIETFLLIGHQIGNQDDAPLMSKYLVEQLETTRVLNPSLEAEAGRVDESSRSHIDFLMQGILTIGASYRSLPEFDPVSRPSAFVDFINGLDL